MSVFGWKENLEGFLLFSQENFEGAGI